MYACAFPCVPEYDLTFPPLPPLIKICLIQVVVPVVARKKGMGEFYTRADGRDPKRPRSLIPEPVSHDPVQAKLVLIALRSNQAPGTFGYDYSKIRSRLDEDIPMAEITVDKNAEAKPPEPQMNSGEAPMKEGREEKVEEHVRMRMQPSPAPFSRYQRSAEHENEGRSGLSTGLTTADIKPPVSEGPRRTVPGGEELEAGCCKCVIM